MEPLGIAAELVAAFVAGIMNSIAGGGTFVTFPTLLWLGFDPKVANATSTLEGIVLDRGLNGVLSNGYTLVANALRWLAEPSLAEGQIGGAAMEASLLDNPHKVRLGRPYAWPVGQASSLLGACAAPHFDLASADAPVRRREAG